MVNGKEFADIYPFICYQQRVFTALIRSLT